MHVGQAEVTALVFVNESFMINAKQVHHGGVQVMDANGIFRHVDAVIISTSVVGPAAYASASHPHGKATGMMIAAIDFVRQLALRVDRTAEFTAPDNQRIVQHAALT